MREGSNWESVQDGPKMIDHTYGYDPPNSFGRIQQLNEALEIIKLMYTRDEPSFSGKYYSIVNAECSPKPIQKPYPPIMVGGTGEKHLLKIRQNTQTFTIIRLPLL